MTHDPLADLDSEILHFLESVGIPPDPATLNTPADRQFGERATNAAMRLARERRMAPRQIAEEVVAHFDSTQASLIAAVEPAGPGFINFRLNYEVFAPQVIEAVREMGAMYGRRASTAPQSIVVEHTSVNPNKEWHIGHVRNAVLGDVVMRLLRLAGNQVQVQNYIDDTGLQAAQAVYALLSFPEQPLPDEKYDHYIGRLYVKIAAEIAAEQALTDRLKTVQGGVPGASSAGQTGIDETASILARLSNIERLKTGILQSMHAIERGEHHDIQQQLLGAQLQTAFRLGIFYDLLNWESHLVGSHLFADAIGRIEQSRTVYRATEGHYVGALVIETRAKARDGDEPKLEVLIRSNGIPTYVGKDIAYHMWKFQLLPDRLTYVEYATQPNGETLWSTALHGSPRSQPCPNRVINIIMVHQSQAQEAVKDGLSAAGYGEQAEHLFHLAYGLVSTAQGKISGRKGTGVSGDTVIDEAVRAAHQRLKEKRSQDLSDVEMERIAEAVGIGALRYFMVQYNPLRDIVFDVADVVSYDGNTGLYVQYALVRMFAILRRGEEAGVTTGNIDAADARLLQHEQEKRLLFHLAQFPELVATACRTLSVNLLAEYAYDLATIFSQFYRDCPVLNAEPALRDARLLLVRTVRDVLTNVCGVLGVPVIERL